MDRIRLYSEEDLEVIGEICRIRNAVAPRLPYHNAQHMEEVARTCEMYATMEGLGYVETRRLRKAGELHDIIYIPGRKDNEELAAEVSGNILAGLGDDSQEINEVARLIIVTDLTRYPTDIMENIIRDSDIDNLGRDDFFEKSELLRKECGVDLTNWYKGNVDFLENAEYYTESARNLRGPKMKQHLEEMKRLRDNARGVVG